jgi:RNA polymerase sigma-70 factor (ECF subfamily)
MLLNRTRALDWNSDSRFMDDAALVAGLQHGDARAVEYVVQRYAPALFRYAYYQLQDAMLAEDLAAEVMTRMIGSIDRFVVGTTPFESWLFRIVRNLIVDEYRVRKRRPQVSFEQWLTEEPDLEPGAHDSRIAALPDHEELRAGLATLTDEQRQVVLLHVVEGWELPQVAQLLDRSVPSVKSLYYRGVQSLRRALTRGGDTKGSVRA